MKFSPEKEREREREKERRKERDKQKKDGERRRRRLAVRKSELERLRARMNVLSHTSRRMRRIYLKRRIIVHTSRREFSFSAVRRVIRAAWLLFSTEHHISAACRGCQASRWRYIIRERHFHPLISRFRPSPRPRPPIAPERTHPYEGGGRSRRNDARLYTADTPSVRINNTPYLCCTRIVRASGG